MAENANNWNAVTQRCDTGNCALCSHIRDQQMEREDCEVCTMGAPVSGLVECEQCRRRSLCAFCALQMVLTADRVVNVEARGVVNCPFCSAVFTPALISQLRQLQQRHQHQLPLRLRPPPPRPPMPPPPLPRRPLTLEERRQRRIEVQRRTEAQHHLAELTNRERQLEEWAWKEVVRVDLEASQAVDEALRHLDVVGERGQQQVREVRERTNRLVEEAREQLRRACQMP